MSLDVMDTVLKLSALSILFPINIISKAFFASFTNRRFIITPSNMVDMAVFILSFIFLFFVEYYKQKELEIVMFGEEEDKEDSVRFLVNVVFDITSDTFHLDYLMAAMTATLWFRCIMLLRLTESFGPLLVMIHQMLLLIVQFLVIYFLGLITLASIATLTLGENPNFANLFESLRTYTMASLGNFDLYQYDTEEGWKRYYGILLHVTVLFINMILIINLLIAIMSDTYASLNDVRTGLYWGTIIKEMPKFAYHKQYGTLSMIPFTFSWLSLIMVPIVFLVKDPQSLETLNEYCLNVAYFPVALCTLAFFMVVNLILLPFAYLKTVVHKFAILRRYKSSG